MTGRLADDGKGREEGRSVSVNLLILSSSTQARAAAWSTEWHCHPRPAAASQTMGFNRRKCCLVQRPTHPPSRCAQGTQHSRDVSAAPCAAVRVLSVYIHPYSYLISAAGKEGLGVSRVARCRVSRKPSCKIMSGGARQQRARWEQVPADGAWRGRAEDRKGHDGQEGTWHVQTCKIPHNAPCSACI